VQFDRSLSANPRKRFNLLLLLVELVLKRLHFAVLPRAIFRLVFSV
jgi:hypothetical protein